MAGGPNSLNPAMAQVLKTDIDLMIDSAGGSPRAVLIAGDLVGGRWPQDADALKGMFGTASSSLQQDLDHGCFGLLYVGAQDVEPRGRRQPYPSHR